MRHYANTAERIHLIAGLRALANFLEENKDIPAPKWAGVTVFSEERTYGAACTEVDGIAALISAVAREGSTGRYSASRDFGPVEYNIVAIPAQQEEG